MNKEHFNWVSLATLIGATLVVLALTPIQNDIEELKASHREIREDIKEDSSSLKSLEQRVQRIDEHGSAYINKKRDTCASFVPGFGTDWLLLDGHDQVASALSKTRNTSRGRSDPGKERGGQ